MPRGRFLPIIVNDKCLRGWTPNQQASLKTWDHREAKETGATILRGNTQVHDKDDYLVAHLRGQAWQHRVLCRILIR